MKRDIQNLSIEDYTYNLPDSAIAAFPLEERDKSRLLILNNGKLSEDSFSNISGHLPDDSLMVFNNTRVVQARLLFYKKTGARIEIFCLDPADKNRDIHSALLSKGKVLWNCLVGNARKWKDEVLTISGTNNYTLNARQVSVKNDMRQIEFSWEPSDMTFSEILENTGKTPLPPYIVREPDDIDKTRYQTVYAENDGSVAAPTAGLHFTQSVFEKLQAKKIDVARLTLHVGAGTFKPVSTDTIGEHKMHAEQIVVNYNTLLKAKEFAGKNIISVGTTSVRTLETLYWWGAMLSNGYKPDNGYFILPQWLPYSENHHEISVTESFNRLLKYLDDNKMDKITGHTELIIVPGYEYKITDYLVTNFHLPKSTLLMLVAAFVGDDWRKAYNYAIENNFRFLSYGDSCLFYKKKK